MPAGCGWRRENRRFVSLSTLNRRVGVLSTLSVRTMSFHFTTTGVIATSSDFVAKKTRAYARVLLCRGALACIGARFYWRTLLLTSDIMLFCLVGLQQAKFQPRLPESMA